MAEAKQVWAWLVLGGRQPGNTKLLLVVVLVGQSGAIFPLVKISSMLQCSDGDAAL